MRGLRISIKNLDFSYSQEKPVLSGISFDVRAGEYVTIWGENGSGKSTLFSCINGLLTPPCGCVTVFDSSGGEFDPADDTRLFELRKTAGTVLQNPDNQLVASTVAEDCAFAPENLGLSPAEVEARVSDALKKTGLEELRGQPVQYLSGGEKQRLAIAGILAAGSEILLLDECTSMIDEEGRTAFYKIIDNLVKNGVTVLQITHLPEEAAQSQRCIVLKNGKIVSDGAPPAEIFEKTAVTPLNSYKKKENSQISVEFSEVFHYYNKKTPQEKEALSNISFVIHENESAALKGRTGSGKSTVLRHINALLLPSSGKVTALAKDTLDKKIKIADFRRQAALCVQMPEAALFEQHVADDVAYGAKKLGLRGAELFARVKNAMDEVGLPFSDFAGRETASLSGGEARLAALAGVLAIDSPVILLDEPAAGLDIRHTKLVEKTLEKLAENGKTIIVSTHQTAFAARFDKIIELTDGKTPETLENTASSSNILSKKQQKSRKTGMEIFRFSPFGTFSGKNSMLRRVPAGIKLFFTAALVLSAAAVPGIVFPLTVLAAALTLGAALSRVPPLSLLQGFVPIMPLMTVFVLLRLFFSQEGGQSAVLLTLGPVVITSVEIKNTIGIIIRLFSMITLFSLYAQTTPLHETLAVLKKRAAQNTNAFFRDMALALGIALRFVPLISYEAEQIAASLLSRGAKTQGLAKIGFLLSILTPLFLRSLERSVKLAKAMLLRLYH